MSTLDLYNGPPNAEGAIELCFSCIENGQNCKIQHAGQTTPTKVRISYADEICPITPPHEDKPQIIPDISFTPDELSTKQTPESTLSILIKIATHERKVFEAEQQIRESSLEDFVTTPIIRKKFTRFRDKKYICDVCDASFTMKQNVASHLFLFHVQPDGTMKKIEKKWYTCQKCPQLFRTPNAAEVHMKKVHVHKKEAIKVRNDCDECDRSFASAFQLREHIAIQHLKERNFKCDQCEQRFGRRGGLRRHVQMVHQNHLHKCPYQECDHPGYKCSKALTAHIRSVHTNIRPFVCAECEKAFVRKNDLKMHELTHRRDVKFSCLCGNTFRRQMYLKKHQKVCSLQSSAPTPSI